MNYEKLDRKRANILRHVLDLRTYYTGPIVDKNGKRQLQNHPNLGTNGVITQYMGLDLFQVYNDFQDEYRKQIDQAKQLKWMKEHEEAKRSNNADTNRKKKLEQKLKTLSKEPQENEKSISKIKKQIKRLEKRIDAKKNRIAKIERILGQYDFKPEDFLKGRDLRKQIKSQNRKLKNYNEIFKYFAKQILKQHDNFKDLHNLIIVLNELGVGIYYNEKGINYKIGNEKRLEDLIEENHLPKETLETIKVALNSFQQYDLSYSYDGTLTKDVIDSNKTFSMSLPDRIEIESLTLKLANKIKDPEYWKRTIGEEHKYKFGRKKEQGKITTFFKKMYIKTIGITSSIVVKAYLLISKKMGKKPQEDKTAFDDEQVIILMVSELLEKDKIGDESFPIKILREIAEAGQDNIAEIKKALTNCVRKWYKKNKYQTNDIMGRKWTNIQQCVDDNVKNFINDELKSPFMTLERLLRENPSEDPPKKRKRRIRRPKKIKVFSKSKEGIPIVNSRKTKKGVNIAYLNLKKPNPYDVVNTYNNLTLNQIVAIQFYERRHPDIKYEQIEIAAKDIVKLKIQGKEDYSRMLGKLRVLQSGISKDIENVIQVNQDLSPDWKQYIKEDIGNINEWIDVFKNEMKRPNVPELYMKKAEGKGVKSNDFQEMMRIANIYSKINQILELSPAKEDKLTYPDPIWITQKREYIENHVKQAPPGTTLENWRQKILDYEIAEHVQEYEYIK